VQAALKESNRSSVTEPGPDIEVHPFVRCPIELEIPGEAGTQSSWLIRIDLGDVFPLDPALQRSSSAEARRPDVDDFDSFNERPPRDGQAVRCYDVGFRAVQISSNARGDLM